MNSRLPLILGSFDIELETPGGIITPQNAENFGVKTVASVEEKEGASDVGPGFYAMQVPYLGSGLYKVNVRVGGPAARKVTGVAQLLSDSDLGATVFTNSDSILAGEMITIVAAVFEKDRAAIGDATAWIRLIGTTNDERSELTLRDDGVAPDAKGGDGLFSGALKVDAVGDYSVGMRVMGRNSLGQTFERHAGSTFSVVSPPE